MVIATLFSCTLVYLSKTEVLDSASGSVKQYDTVILDAGHGGFDGGAVASDGTVEKDINLSIALKVRDFLKLGGVDVIMTRDVDTGTEDDVNQSISARKKSDLYNRLQLMQENPDALFVSVHLNKFTTSAASGTQVFYSPDFSDARILGEKIQSEVVSMLQPENTRVVKQGNKKTFLLSKAPIPAVIVECGFLSNAQELERLKNSQYQSQMAMSISLGVLDFLNSD